MMEFLLRDRRVQFERTFSFITMCVKVKLHPYKDKEEVVINNPKFIEDYENIDFNNAYCKLLREECEEEQFMNNNFLNNLKEDNNGLGWLEGMFESKSLFQGEMNITIMDNTDVAKEYAEKCIVHYNALNNNKELLEKIQEGLAKFMLYMYEEWKAMSEKRNDQCLT